MKTPKTESKHTPEPWATWGLNAIVDTREEIIAVSLPRAEDVADSNTQVANAARIVACVNGCAGIPDPETLVPELIEALWDLVRAHEVEMGPSALQLRIDLATGVLAKLEGGAK